MYKKLLFIIIFLCLFSTIFIGIGQASTTEKLDVKINPFGHVSNQFWTSNKGDEIDIMVDSNMPVNVYIVTSENYFQPSDLDIERAKYAEFNETYTKFTYRIPDDQKYFLIIENPNLSIATVDYEYTESFDEDVGSALCGVSICVMILVIGIILFIILMVYLTSRNKRIQPPHYPPQQPYYPPQQYYGYQPPPPAPQPYYYPPPPPGY